MKSQQHSAQESYDRIREQKQELQTHIQTQMPQLPMQQWIQLLRQGEGLSELPASLLEQLAQTAGNSSLTALLRRGGGDDPLTYVLEDAAWERKELDVNDIQTVPPVLVPYSEWPEWSGVWPQPSKPDGIRNRG